MERTLKTMDGNTAAAHVAYAFTEVAAIYPITPSSTMAELVDEWSAKDVKNIFGQKVNVIEMQSEGGAAGAVHGSLVSGALTSTFTASQGLLLMVPNMYKIAGEGLPAVFHISARTIASHALSIFGDHSDVMACRQTGFAMLASNSPQEAMDLAPVAHLATLKGRVPFLHFFDGFRTSHEMQKVATWDYEELAEMFDYQALNNFRNRANSPANPSLRGSAQNGDIFFQTREASNAYYDALPDIVADVMADVNSRIGTDYAPFNYYGAPDAEYVIVAMGSACEAAEEVVDYLAASGEKVGLLKVRLYRPFSQKYLLEALPKAVKNIVVLDRTKEPGALGEPLYLDIVSALAGTEFAGVRVYGGRYGLASKDVTPGAIISAVRNIQSDSPKHGFTIGIVDDVTGLSLPIEEEPDTTPADIISCKFWGLGSDGTVGANKNSIKIIGDYTDKNVQAYFQYDSKKSGGVTVSHLRFGDSPIKSTYYITKADFVACHNPSYATNFPIAQDTKPGGAYMINCAWDVDELGAKLPADAKRYIAENNVKVYTVDAVSLAKEIGLGNRTNTILQSAFFKLANILPIDDAVKYMKNAALESYGKRGEAIVQMNYDAIDAGLDRLVEIQVPESWKDAVDGNSAADKTETDHELLKYIYDVMGPVNSMRGDTLPVSVFANDSAHGVLPAGTAAFEKRGIATDVPRWIPENCTQCNACSFVCPHAVIRPFVFTADELAAAPEGTKAVKMVGKGCETFQYSIISSVLDCTGCEACVNACPSKEKAIVMTPIEEMIAEQKVYDFAYTTLSEKELPFKTNQVKGSQFLTPLLEFSGACAGCGETPYAKLVTQLFGDRMYIANATGCSSIWGGSAPSTPYTVNRDGRGPAWSNSLFEDNAEFGFGMLQGVKARRALAVAAAQKILALDHCYAPLREATENWLAVKDDAEASKTASAALVAALIEGTDVDDMTGTKWEAFWDKENKWCLCPACSVARDLLAMKDVFVKPSFWIFGGDGWAYDIGYGGLDHVIASGENVNILVFDTEVYSNTGGQASKASQTGQVAQFAAAGKAVKKKDLAQIAISYGYVYVAQVAMGANNLQTIKAITEAESYDGPSLIIAYAPCIAHGNKNGMGKAQDVSDKAVKSGYWNNFRFDPRLESQGENPLSIDSKAPSIGYRDFIMDEVRYTSLVMNFPERAEELFTQAEENAKVKYEKLLQQKEMLDKK